MILMEILCIFIDNFADVYTRAQIATCTSFLLPCPSPFPLPNLKQCSRTNSSEHSGTLLHKELHRAIHSTHGVALLVGNSSRVDV